MASTYPSAVDTFTRPGATLAGPPTHTALIEKLQDAVTAVETSLGTGATAASKFTYLYGLRASAYGPGTPSAGPVLADNAPHQACQLLVSPAATAGLLLVFGQLTVSGGTSGVHWKCDLRTDGGTTFSLADWVVVGTDDIHTFSLVGVLSVAAAAQPFIRMFVESVSGIGTVNFANTSYSNQINALFIPTA